MTRISRLLLSLVLLTCAASAQVVGYSYANPQTLTYPSVEYGSWVGTLLTGNTGTGSQTYLIATTGSHPGNRTAGVNPFNSAILTPVTFNNEIITPTAVA